MTADPVDALAATLSDIPARELDDMIVRKLIDIAKRDDNGQLLLKTQEAANEASETLRLEIAELATKRNLAENGVATAKRKLADAYMEDDTNVVRAMSARMDDLTLEADRLKTSIQGKQDALAIISNAAGEVEAVRGRINLVEAL